MKRITRTILLTLLVLAMACPGVSAAENRGWNIMLVIDGSNSLVSQSGFASDVAGLRYEAINALLDVLKDGGHQVGAVVFSAQGTDRQGQAQEAILCNTGLLPLDEAAEELKAEIPKHMSRLTKNGTDIGAALLCAQQELAKANDGRKSAIFLFTDGANEVDPALEAQSAENRAQAIDGIRAAGTEFLGVYLDSSGQDLEDVKNIVREVYPELTGEALEANYMRLETADQISAAGDKFLALVGKQLQAGETLTESWERYFHLPGAGVNTVDLRFQTTDGSDLPERLTVSIIAPDGTVYTDGTEGVVCSGSRTYRVYKLEKPMGGDWVVQAQCPEGAGEVIEFVPIYDLQVGAVLQMAPEAPAVNRNLEITALLTQGGEPVLEPEAYADFTCTMWIIDQTTGQSKEYPIEPDADGMFRLTLKPQVYGSYLVKARLESGELSAEAEQAWALSNTPPTASGPVILSHTVVRLLEQEQLVDLSAYLSDQEDGTLLQLELDESASTCNMEAVNLMGQSLHYRPSALGSGILALRAYDSQGAGVTLLVEVEVVDLTWLVLGLLALLLAAALVQQGLQKARNRKHQAQARLDGVCQVSIEIHHGILNLRLPVPGRQGIPRQTNLKELLESNLPALTEACREFNRKYQQPDEDGIVMVEPITAELVLAQYRKEFAAIELSVVAELNQREVISKLRVTGSGMTANLLGNSRRLPLDDSSDVTITYLPREKETPVG